MQSRQQNKIVKISSSWYKKSAFYSAKFKCVCAALTRDGPGAVDFAVLPGQEGGRVCLLQLEEVLRGPGVVTSAGTPHEFVHPVEVCGLNLPATEEKSRDSTRHYCVCTLLFCGLPAHSLARSRCTIADLKYGLAQTHTHSI